MWWLLACGKEPVVTGGCTPDPDNVLRARCSFEVDPPGPLTLEVSDGAVVEPRPGDGAGSTFAVWRMRPEATYRWTARAGEGERVGTLETAALPPEVQVRVERSGDPLPDDVLMLVGCGTPTVVALEPGGDVVWYQRVADDLPPPHQVVGLTWTPEGTVLVVVDRERIREYDLDGTLLRELLAPPDRIVHHDVFRRDGWTYVLRARVGQVEGREYLIDGVLGYDDAGAVAFDWDLASLATVSGPGGFGQIYWTDDFPDAIDWAHANGLYVDEGGDFVISLHTFSTVLRVVGDPAADAFGSVVWSLEGAEAGPFGSDFAVTAPDGNTDDLTFGHQHHPSLLADGSLLLFDNGEGLTDEARLLNLALADGEAVVRGSWPLGLVCPIEGGAYELSTGDLLGTCALRSTFLQVGRDDGAVRSTTQATCVYPDGLQLIPRAIPVSLAR